MQTEGSSEKARILIVAPASVGAPLAERLLALGHEVIQQYGQEDPAKPSVRPQLILVAVLPGAEQQAVATGARFRRKTGAPVVMLEGEGTNDTILEKEGFYAHLPEVPSDGELAITIRMALMQARQAVKNQNELALAQERLIQSDRLASIGQLAAGVAHEINNPVGYISSNIGTLGEYVDDLFRLIDAYRTLEMEVGEDSDTVLAIRRLGDEIQIDFLRDDLGNLVNECQEGVSRVRQIIEDLKDFSRAGEGEWETVDLHQAMVRTLNIVHNELKYKADVVQEFGELPPVNCQPSQINQVMMNLLINAAQAIDGHGQITIRSGVEDDDHVWFEVEDTGKGIEPDKLKHIFDPFFTTKPVGQGTGLGLSISYGIVQRHGGRIEVDSRPGEGSRFRVSLPRRGADKALT